MESAQLAGRPWIPVPSLTQRLFTRAASLAMSADRLPILFYWIVFLLVLLSAVFASQGGIVHREIEQYIPHYLSEAPFWHKIYDYQKVEVGVPPDFRPRPLSYIIDSLDVRFIAWSAKVRHPHFLSASYFLFWTASGALMWFSFRTLFKLDRLNSGLLILLISVTPALYLYTSYFRSAKAASIFFLLCGFITLWTCYQSVRADRHLGKTIWTGILGYFCLLLGCLCDEIPVAFSGTALLLLIRELLTSRERNRGRAALACAVPIGLAIVTFMIYDLYGHARMVSIITGESVVTTYQSHLLYALRQGTAVHLIGTASVFTEVFGFLLGGISSILSICVLVVLVWCWGKSSGPRAVTRIVLCGLILAGVLFVMISRHPPIMSFDVRRGYYTNPFLVVFLFFVAISISRMLEMRFLSRNQVRGILFVLVLSNISCLAREWRFPADGKDPGREYSRAMILALKSNQGITPAMLNDIALGDYFKKVAVSPIYKRLTQANAFR